jgi:tRNA-Thr(GGU) m(6)t(6)A37 methyltransferase TsaA
MWASKAKVGFVPQTAGYKWHATGVRLGLAMDPYPCQFAAMTAIKSEKTAPPGASNNENYGLREGEIAAALPAAFDASLYYIGRIRTPWRRREECPKNGRETEAVCTIELDPRWAAGLTGLDTVSHVVLLYWMDQARRDLVLQSPRHYAEHRGTFALRSPARPNPIAVSVVRLVGIDGTTLKVIGLDCLDGTPLLDIKPYFASTDSVPDASVGWHAMRGS